MAARRKARQVRKPRSAARSRAARAAWSRRRAEVRAGAASFAQTHGTGHQLAQVPSWARRNPRRRNGRSAAAGKRLAGLQAAYMRRLEVAWRRKGPHPQSKRDLERMAELSRAMGRASSVQRARELHEQTTASTSRRKGNPMKKKRTPAQRAAFRKMIAGLKAYKGGARGKSRRKARRKAKRATAVVVVTNPRRKKRRKNASRGGSIMAKRRRTRRHGTVARSNPRRRRHRRNPSHHRRHRRRRNPGGGNVVAIVKSTISAAVPAMAAGGLMALIDNKLLGDKALPVQVVGKLVATAAVGHVLRNRPRTAALAMGAMLGGLGYQLVAKMGGGVVTANSKDAAKEISALIRQDARAMQALVNTDGSLRTVPSLSGMGAGMGDGGTALPTAPIFDPVTLG